MPARTLLPALRRHPARLAAAATTAVVIAVAATVGGGSGAAATPLGPTATATARELATTLETAGVVERISERTISYGGDRSVSAAAGTGAAAPPGADATAGGPATAATTAPAADRAATTTTTTTAAPATDTASTTATTAPAATDSTTATTAPPPEPAACPAAGSDSTTAPAACSTAPATVPTTSPPSTTTTTTPPPASASPAATASAQPVTATAPAEAEEEDPVILTTVAAAGSEVGRNTVLYSADDEPVVALVGTVPAWRAFETGMEGGSDVRQLEENLTELGYGAGLTIDDDFTAATAAAVKRWEAAVGRADPDGVVDAGDVVFLAEPGRVLGLEAAVGDPLEAGTPVLVVGTRQQVVSGTVAVTDSVAWGSGTDVALEWSDGTVTAGTVSSTGTEVTDGLVALVVALSDADSLRPTGAQVAVSTAGARAAGAVSVPVAAVIAGPGGKAAVRQAVAGEKADRVVPVTTGIVAGGWVEIRSGLETGDEVRLPG